MTTPVTRESGAMVRRASKVVLRYFHFDNKVAIIFVARENINYNVYGSDQSLKFKNNEQIIFYLTVRHSRVM